MKLGPRLKLFIAVFVLISTAVLSTGFVLGRFLTNNLAAQIERELAAHAASARVIIESSEKDVREKKVADALADRLGKAISARVTIILESGEVIGDSDLDLPALKHADNHAHRPEVRRALDQGLSTARRHSETLETDMLYVAKRFDNGSTRGVIRIAKPLSEVKNALAQVKGVMVVVGLAGLGIALLVSVLSSYLFSRALKTLVEFARKTVKGEKPKPISTTSTDEFGGLIGSLNVLSEQLEEHVTTLAQERDRFQEVLEGMNEAVLAIDEQHKITMINRAGIMMLGLTGQPLGGTLLETLRVPALQEMVLGLEKGGEATGELDLPVGDANYKILARIRRRRTGGFVIVLLDVTEMRRLESLRRDFVSNVSHELRTPVSIIRANTETLLAGALDDRQAAERFLGSMLDNAERLSALISDLLDISRIEAGKYDIKAEPLPVGISLRRAAAALETKAMDKGFSIEVEPVGDLRVSADARALGQVLYNLTDNAVKYTEENGRVILRATPLKDKSVRIEVEDNGPGVPPEHRDRLFERFYRVDPGRSREMGGTGLGLAIVKHLVTAMDGELGMEPAHHRGSVFWFTLPMVMSTAPD